MLAEKYADAVPLPQVNSVGFLRGTAQRARILRRNADENAGGERTCLVQLFERIPFTPNWQPVLGSTGNATVEERDLYPTQDAAQHAGRRRSRSRR